jgi:hypothetical protein
MRLKQHILSLSLNILVIFLTIIKNLFANKYKNDWKKYVRTQVFVLFAKSYIFCSHVATLKSMLYTIEQTTSSKTSRRSTKLNWLKQRRHKSRIFYRSKTNNNRLIRNNKINELILCALKRRKERLFKAHDLNAFNSLN